VSKISGGAKDSEAHIANMCDESDKASADFGRNPKEGVGALRPTSAGASFAPGLCRTACEYSRYALRRASRPEAKSCQRRMGFIMLCTLRQLGKAFRQLFHRGWKFHATDSQQNHCIDLHADGQFYAARATRF
jgi:hypothetical protein